MILLDNLLYSSEFRVVRTKIKDIWYCKGTIPVYYYQWTPIQNPGSRNLLILPHYSLTHHDNKEIVGDFNELLVNELYKGSLDVKEKIEEKRFNAKNTIYSQLYYILRILQWYQKNPSWCSASLIKYLKHTLASYSEFYNPKVDWSRDK